MIFGRQARRYAQENFTIRLKDMLIFPKYSNLLDFFIWE